MAIPAGSFIWYELMTPDPDAARDFYPAVVGWSIAGPSQGGGAPVDYRHITRSDGGDEGGVFGLSPDMIAGGARPAWVGYLYSADVDATVRAVVDDGGRVLMPAMDLPVGRFVMVADPQGAPVYVMTPVPPPGKDDTRSDVFSPTAEQRVGWNELASPDLAASKAFYARHFGFEFNEAMSMGPMGDYCFVDCGGERIGAMYAQQEQGQPVMWQFYFRVPGIAAAKLAIEAHGGTVLMGPHEVPGGDWIVVATDPQGVRFGLVGGKGE